MADDVNRNESFLAGFDSAILWMLQPICDWAQKTEPLRFLGGSLFVEPCVEGGVMVVAVSGNAMAVVRDPNGFATGAAVLALPSALFAACQPPEPIRQTYCGEVFELSPPEWMQPGRFYASSAGIFLQPRMRAPAFADHPDPEFHPTLFDAVECGRFHRVGLDYKFNAGVAVDWRKVVSMAMESGTGEADLIASPVVIGLFSRLNDGLRRPDGVGGRVFHRQRKSGAIVVQFEGTNDALGLYMRQTLSEAPAWPTWFSKRVSPLPHQDRAVQ